MSLIKSLIAVALVFSVYNVRAQDDWADDAGSDVMDEAPADTMDSHDSISDEIGSMEVSDEDTAPAQPATKAKPAQKASPKAKAAVTKQSNKKVAKAKKQKKAKKSKSNKETTKKSM